jgi:RHH-type transcriptional regulator, proline utilization regulon repressor / proline dehydrogenase / delta 1-pyrroline-5-carboxylate dehydrogenase
MLVDCSCTHRWSSTMTSPPHSPISCVGSTRTRHHRTSSPSSSISRTIRSVSSAKPTGSQRRSGVATPSTPTTAAPGPNAAPDALAGRCAVHERRRHRLDPRAPTDAGSPATCRPVHAATGRSTSEPPIGTAEVDRAIGVARAAQAGWWSAGPDERAAILHRVGDVLEQQRGTILATMAHEAGKTAGEGDPEVSEAVDFARYYAADARRLSTMHGASPQPLGTVVVAPPWNFPLAIPAGGVLAALAAGSDVILKPAPQSARTAALLAAACWEAGVPRDVLQFLPAPDGDVGRRLVTHDGVDAVVLTGAYATASMFHDWRPALRLHAETSGKNAIVVTATADIDLAVADIVRSAFGHAGQKCSAASLAIVDARLYDDPRFLERLRDAAATLARRGGARPGDRRRTTDRTARPGARTSAHDARGRRDVAPVPRVSIRRPAVVVARDPPRRTAGSWFARTECFGPVLGVVRATSLDDAIRIQNSTDYGLTAGLHAFDPDEVTYWLERVEAGNLYVNRGITGAIVRRQPFGGWKRSAVGPTMKAGGPNYVASLMHWSDTADVDLALVEERYERWMAEVGHAEHDATGLLAEHNFFRYRPTSGIAFRFGADRDRPAAASRRGRRPRHRCPADHFRGIRRRRRRVRSATPRPRCRACPPRRAGHRQRSGPARMPRTVRRGRRCPARQRRRDRTSPLATRTSGEHHRSSPRPSRPTPSA